MTDITLDTFIQRVNNIENSLNNDGQKILQLGEGYVLSIQKKRIAKGKTVSGKKIRTKKKRKDTPPNKPYTRQYARYKAKRGGNVSFVDLQLDGDFLNSLEAMSEGMAFVVQSLDPKQGKVKGLFASYDDIIGISEKEAFGLNEILTSGFIESAQNSLVKL